VISFQITVLNIHDYVLKICNQYSGIEGLGPVKNKSALDVDTFHSDDGYMVVWLNEEMTLLNKNYKIFYNITEY
jgi:hypothetical protein